MKVYVASSWRNAYQPEVVRELRAAGHEVYDFKNPKEGDHGFHWEDVGLERNEQGLCLPADLQRALAHPVAVEGFASDFGAMKWADACVLVLPCGRSAHLEAGWMAGQDMPTFVLAPPGPIEPELMYGLLGKFCLTVDEVIASLHPKHYPAGMGEESRGEESAMTTAPETAPCDQCGSCGQNAAQPEHTCPYQSDINDDDETMCNCCDDCTQQCTDDI